MAITANMFQKEVDNIYRILMDIQSQIDDLRVLIKEHKETR